MATDKTILEAVAYLMASYPLMQRDTEETKGMRLKVCRDQWGDIDDTLLLAAVKQTVSERESEYPPAIGLIRNKALSLANHARGTIDAMTAWGVVMSAARGIGRDATKDELRNYFSRHLSAAASDAVIVIVGRMGWRDICNCDEDQLNTLRAQFRGAWDTEQARERERNLMTPAVRDVVQSLAQGMDMNRMLNGRKADELESGK